MIKLIDTDLDMRLTWWGMCPYGNWHQLTNDETGDIHFYPEDEFLKLERLDVK